VCGLGSLAWANRVHERSSGIHDWLDDGFPAELLRYFVIFVDPLRGTDARLGLGLLLFCPPSG